MNPVGVISWFMNVSLTLTCLEAGTVLTSSLGLWNKSYCSRKELFGGGGKAKWKALNLTSSPHLTEVVHQKLWCTLGTMTEVRATETSKTQGAGPHCTCIVKIRWIVMDDSGLPQT